MTKAKPTRKAKPGTATKKAANRRKPVQPKLRAKSKQAEVLELLRRPQSATIPAIMTQKARPDFGIREARLRRPHLSHRGEHVGQSEGQTRPRP
jgi:hypothetical protein